MMKCSNKSNIRAKVYLAVVLVPVCHFRGFNAGASAASHITVKSRKRTDACMYTCAQTPLSTYTIKDPLP